ncbi:MAG: peptidoglycan-binding protein, partial [Myxococcota bacterium]
LLGQPELDQKLKGQGLRQLRQRISVRWQLSPLSAEETYAYIRHRVRIAASGPKELFSESALRLIHRRTGGVPRLINQLCDRALLAGYAAGQPRIDSALIRTAAREIPDTRGGGNESETGGWRLRWSARTAILAAILVAVVMAMFTGIFVDRSGFISASQSFFRDPSALEARFDSPSIDSQRPSNVLEAPAATPRERVVTPEVDRARPEVTPLAKGLFARLLRHRDVQLAIAESRDAILEGAGRPIPVGNRVPTDTVALRSSIEERGLVATFFDGGSLELLRRLEHPVVLAFTPNASSVATPPGLGDGLAESKSLWLALLGFDGDRGHLAGVISGRVVSVPVRELRAHWLETGMIVWNRYEPLPERLSLGEEGEGVDWLQRSLAELQFFSGQSDGRFGDDTKNALLLFQEQTGIIPDGIAGPLTQIALYGQLDRYPVPRLSTFLDPSSSSASPLPGDRP